MCYNLLSFIIVNCDNAHLPDEIPHEVLATASLDDDDESQSSSSDLDRYALTVWIPTENISWLHNESSKFSHLAKDLF